MSDDLPPEERELIDWLDKVHREVGVTPALRGVMERYWHTYPEERPNPSPQHHPRRPMTMSDDNCNLPFERLPQCACDPGRGEPPSRLKRLECRMRGGLCSPARIEADEPSIPAAEFPPFIAKMNEHDAKVMLLTLLCERVRSPNAEEIAWASRRAKELGLV